ncbi:hypothetical protein GCM10009090_13620 [[Pseudomonas] boreopolis]|uniref:Uncharacterized protein n=2 Tax=Xanthomonas boreopolis TaxID=86183 RepID=A0A919F6S9_9XANT|nr:hypothetical protein GCM10009090_13620 [[Pseudomonas] boreopolis]
MVFDDGGSTFEDIGLNGCVFDNCGLSLAKSPEGMTRVKGVVATKCKVVNSEIGPCVFEDVVIDELATNPILLIWSSFFRRVRLSGKIGKIGINVPPEAFFTDSKVLHDFSVAREAFYRETDWALDISDAKFVDFRCEGIPLDLIRRDPETQVVIRKSMLPRLEVFERGFRKDFRELYFSLVDFLESPRQEELLVVPLGAPKARRDAWASGIGELRSRGFLAEG